MAVCRRQVSGNKIANDRHVTKNKKQKRKRQDSKEREKRLISILHISISDYVASYIKS
jgi:hypothetical protein